MILVIPSAILKWKRGDTFRQGLSVTIYNDQQ